VHGNPEVILPHNGPLRLGDLDPNTRFFYPTLVNISNSIMIGLAAFAGLTIVTDRQTTLLRLYLVLRCGLKISTENCTNVDMILFT